MPLEPELQKNSNEFSFSQKFPMILLTYKYIPLFVRPYVRFNCEWVNNTGCNCAMTGLR